jgi:hypothetical protein
MVVRLVRTLLVASLCALALSGVAQAAGGNYVFDGGTPKQQMQVRSALDASSFDWNLVPAQVTIHLAPNTDSYARRGHIYIDSNLLSAGRYAWAVVQDEYAHQIDFYLFDDATRATLNTHLGGKDWCYGVLGFGHSEYGCERFASTLVWSYWPSKDNTYKPTSKDDESAAIAPAKFRALMTDLIGAPSPMPVFSR